MGKFTVSCTMNVTYGSLFFTSLSLWSHPSFNHPRTSNCTTFVRVCISKFSGLGHLIAEKKIFVHKLRLLLKIYMCTHAKAKVPWNFIVPLWIHQEIEGFFHKRVPWNEIVIICVVLFETNVSFAWRNIKEFREVWKYNHMRWTSTTLFVVWWRHLRCVA